MDKFYIGLANSYHDSALCLVNSRGEIVFAEATERSLQNKRAVDCVPDRREIVAKILTEFCPQGSDFAIARTWSDGMSRKLKVGYLLNLLQNKRTPQTSDTVALTNLMKGKIGWGMGAGTAMLHLQAHTGQRLFQFICERYKNSRVTFANYPHHLTHAANACYTSPFAEASCVIVDGMGEDSSLSYYHYSDGQIRLLKNIKQGCSLGHLYEICTYFCGFNLDRGEEWKLMGLAPYGELDEGLYRTFREIIQVDGLSVRYASRTSIDRLIRVLMEKNIPIQKNRVPRCG